MQRKKETETSETEKPWELHEQSLVSVLSESHYSPREFAEALGSPSFTELLKSIQRGAWPWIKALFKVKVYSHIPRLNRRFAKECGLGLFAKRCWEIRSITFSYNSQTVDGRDVVLSGRVTFLHHKDKSIPHEAKTISLHTHQSFLDPSWAPLHNLMFVPLKVLWDSVVIEPDLQKWGITYRKEAEGGGSAVHMARQLADCTVAALEILYQQGVSLAQDGYTTNWGTSQGALPALLFARWYETEAPQWFREALRLKSTFTAEGATIAHEYMKFTYQHPEYISVGFTIMVSYFRAFTPEQLGGFKPAEFVPQWYHDTKFQVDGKEISFFDAISLNYQDIADAYIPQITTFDKILAPDILLSDGTVDFDSPKMRAWLTCTKNHNNLEGWTPEHPIYFAHCPKDDMMPYEEAYRLYRLISNDGRNPNVHMLQVPSMRFLPNGGMSLHMIVAFVGQIIMAFVENPESMKKIYKSVQ